MAVVLLMLLVIAVVWGLGAALSAAWWVLSVLTIVVIVGVALVIGEVRTLSR
jgi:hypothetical protein